MNNKTGSFGKKTTKGSSPTYVYALYKGDTFLAEGTVKEISKKLGISPQAVIIYGTPSYAKRAKNGRRLVKIAKLDSEGNEVEDWDE